MRMMDFEPDHRFARRLGRLRRQARWILAGTALCGLAALVISLLMPKIYRATTDILVSESKIGATPAVPSWQYALLPTYVPFVDNDALLAKAIRRFHLDQPPYSLTPHRLRSRDYLDVSIPKSMRLLEISVEFPDARLAADLANFLARTAVEFNTEMNAQDTESTQSFLKQRMDQAAARLADTEAIRLRVREKARIEDKEKELSILLAQKEKMGGELQQLTLALAQNQSRASSLQQALSQVPKTVRLKKSLTADRTLERAADKHGLLAATLLSLAVWVGAPWWLHGFFGNALAASADLLRMLAPVLPLVSLNTLLFFVFVAARRRGAYLGTLTVGVAAGTVLGLLLAPRYGAAGSVIAALVREFVMTATFLYLLARENLAPAAGKVLLKMLLAVTMVSVLGASMTARLVLAVEWPAAWSVLVLAGTLLFAGMPRRRELLLLADEEL